MGDCARNCKRIAGISLIEASTTNLSKKIKTGFEDIQLNIELESHHRSVKSPEHTVIPAASPSNSGGICSVQSRPDEFPVSRCSSNESSEALQNRFRFVDLEDNSLETESSTCIYHKFSRETTPSSGLCENTDEMDCQEKKSVAKCRRRISLAESMPSQAEIEEFFSVAEKNEQKRFADKYNYDIVMDVPLEGRYQWVRLKHERIQRKEENFQTVSG